MNSVAGDSCDPFIVRTVMHPVDALVQRDVREMTRIDGLDAIPKLLALASTQTSRPVNLSQMARSFDLTRPTIASFLALTERLFLIEDLPPWFSNRAKRLIKALNRTTVVSAHERSSRCHVASAPGLLTRQRPPFRKAVRHGA